MPEADNLGACAAQGILDSDSFDFGIPGILTIDSQVDTIASPVDLSTQVCRQAIYKSLN